VERRGASFDDGLRDLERAARDLSGWPEELCDHLVRRLGGAADDVAILAVRLGGPPGDRLELRVHANAGALSAMRRSLEAWLVRAGADEDEAYDVVLAVGEAAANAVEHAYGPAEAEFDVSAEKVGGAVRVAIGDSGRWRPARGEHRGRGITLMRQLMDTVDVESGERGTVVKMGRALGTRRPG
jgi:anti-sigma regulatory factor (Ser/Thr protein kinase)